MNLNKKELKKIIYDFNSISNRFIRVNYDEYLSMLDKFLVFLDKTPIVSDYINDCGTPTINIENEYEAVISSYDDEIFEIGNTTEEEVANIYAILNCLREKECDIPYQMMAYSNSKKLQDIVRDFNERVPMVLIRNIEGFLTKIGIDMGMDDNTTFAITVNSGQVNIASDNSTINAVQNNGISIDELKKLLSDVRSNTSELSNEDKETVSDCLEVIEVHAAEATPRKSLIKNAITTLKGIKGVVEFGAAVTALAEFIIPLLT
jgi:hypothetical protein